MNKMAGRRVLLIYYKHSMAVLKFYSKTTFYD